jgi:hypothetical protein
MKKLLLILLTTLLFSCDKENNYIMITEKEFNKGCEIAYFEGQRDALENDIRIKRNQDSCWIWCKSPWDNGKAPIYNPSFNCK